MNNYNAKRNDQKKGFAPIIIGFDAGSPISIDNDSDQIIITVKTLSGAKGKSWKIGEIYVNGNLTDRDAQSDENGNYPILFSYKKGLKAVDVKVSFFNGKETVRSSKVIEIQKPKDEKGSLDIIGPMMGDDYSFKLLVAVRNEAGKMAGQEMCLSIDKPSDVTISDDNDPGFISGELISETDKYVPILIKFDGYKRVVTLTLLDTGEKKEFILEKINGGK